MINPLPCPFCSGINIIHCAHHMYCHACGADGPDADSAYESEALEAWNRRAQPAQAVPQHQYLTAEGVAEQWTAQAVPVLTDAEIDNVRLSLMGTEYTLFDFARAVEAAVRAKMGAGVGWRDIETAPKDGTNVLCWSAEFGARESRSITYTPGSPGHAEGKTDRWWEWLEPKKNWAFNWSPTHWMPLPPPPGIAGKEGA